MSEDRILFDTRASTGGKHIGLVTLNSPKTLNAISLDMVDDLYAGLKRWAEDDGITCILIRGSGDRAFCAGGDIQAMYHAMTENPGEPCPYTETFFFHEYRLDYLIHTYPKPVLVWGNGIVMGGGLGIFAGGDLRVVTENSRLAMPEITIALYPDVGGSYFLNRMPGHCGRFLALTGASFNAADCLYLGLGDIFLEHACFESVLENLGEQRFTGDKHADLEQIKITLSDFVNASEHLCGDSNVAQHGTIIDDYFHTEDTHTLIDRFLMQTFDDKWLQKAQTNLSKGSPLAALIIDEQLNRSKEKRLADVFRSELVLSTNITRFSEFTEGIRALLIDKDNAPRWYFEHHRDIPSSFVERFFVAPWETNPLATLEG